MVAKEFTRRQVALTSVPSIQVSTGAAQFAQKQAQVFSDFSIKLEAQRDIEVAAEGKKAGKAEGAAGTFKPVDDTTIWARAFNEAGLASYANRLERKTRLKIGELKAEFPSNPAEFNKRVVAFKAGIMGEAKSVSPELAQVLGDQYDILAAGASSQIKNVFNTQLIDRQKSETKLLMDQIINDLDDRAPEAFSADIETSSRFVNQFQSDAARVNILMNQKLPNGQPMFKEEYKTDKRLELRDQFLSTTLRGQIAVAPDKNAMLARIMKGDLKIKFKTMDAKTGNITTQTIDPLANMSFDAKKKIIGEARSEARRESAALKADTAAASAAVKAGERAGAKGLLSEFSEKGFISEASFKVVEDDLSVSDQKFFGMQVHGNGVLESGDDELKELFSAVDDDTTDAGELATAMFENRRITFEDAIRFRNLQEKRDNQEDAPSVFRTADDQLSATIKSIPNFGKFDPIAIALPRVQANFRRFFREFKDQEHPTRRDAAGVPEKMNRNPNADEVDAFITREMATFVDKARVSMTEKVRFGTPLVRTPDGKLDRDATAEKLFIKHKTNRRSPPSTWPAKLKNDLQALQDFQATSAFLDELKGVR